MVFFISHLSQAQSVNAQFDVGKFQSENKTYIETYLSIEGNSVNYVLNDNNKFQSSLVITIELISNDSNSLYDKYNLSSPEIDDTSNVDFVFIDQQRYFLNDGDYKLKLNIKDNNDSKNSITHQQDLTIRTQNGFSNIQLVDNYSDTKEVNILSKSGYDLVPFISNFYNTNNKKTIR